MSTENKVCIIDDDHIFRLAFSRVLKNHHPEISLLCFSDSKEALNYFQETIEQKAEMPEVIFIDINMPGMDGWQFLSDFSLISHKLPKQIALNMLSSSKNPLDIEMAAKNPNVNKYIIKPYTTAAMSEMFQQELGAIA